MDFVHIVDSWEANQNSTPPPPNTFIYSYTVGEIYGNAKK